MTDMSSPGQERADKPAHNQPSDARIILGPLVKYAAVGFVIMVIIVSTAITLDRQFNTIDQEIAALQAQLSGPDQPATANAVEAAETTATNDQPDLAAVEPDSATVPAEAAGKVAVPQQPETAINAVSSETDEASVDAIANVEEPAPALRADGPEVDIEAEATVPDSREAAAPAGSRTHYGFFEWPTMDPFMAQRDAFLRERDRMYLEGYRASRQKQLQLMRDRAARQERRFGEMEQHYQEPYDLRETDMRDSREMRDSLLPDRI